MIMMMMMMIIIIIITYYYYCEKHLHYQMNFHFAQVSSFRMSHAFNSQLC